MSVSTLRPTGTTSNTGTLTGGATAHAVLADNSDLSYITFLPDEGCAVTLGDFTLPADAVVKSVAWRLRCSSGGGGQRIQSNLLSGSEVAAGQIQATWTTPTTVTVRSGVTEFASGVNLTDALIDAASLTSSNDSAGTVLVLEAYVDVTYVTQPVVGVAEPTGTVSDDTSPTVVWLQAIDSAGGNVTAFEVKIGTTGFDPDDDEAVVESGITADNTPNGFNGWAIPEHLDDGSYEAHVRVRQTVNGAEHWSDWDFESFVIDALRPAAPTLTLTPEDSQGRMLIELEQGTQERTNIAPNPRLGVDTTNWVNTGLASMTRVTSLPASGAPTGVTTGLTIVGNSNADNAAHAIGALNPALIYRVSMYVRLASLSATNLGVVGLDGITNIGSITITTVGGNMTRYDFTIDPVSANPISLLFVQNGAGAVNATITAVLVEEGSAAAGTYFDGASDNAAWTGTAHNSSSVQGADTNLFFIERSDDGGATWTGVRTGHESGFAFLDPVAGAASTYDYEGSNGVSVQYRATAIAVTDLDPVTFISSAYATDSAMWEDTAIWLKDPANPQLNVRIP